jgi:hypothetical protein
MFAAIRRASSRVSSLAAVRPARFFSSRRPFLQYSRPLSDCQPNARPVLDGRDKDFSRLVEVVTGVQQSIDIHTIPAPCFDLVKVAQVGAERIVSLLV